MDNDAAPHLKMVALFSGLSDEAVSDMASRVEKHTLAEGAVLMRKGDPGDSLYIIRTGWVKIVTEGPDGRELVLNQFGAGEVVGEMSVIDQEPRSATVIAMTPLEVLELKSDIFLATLGRQPELALRVMRNLSARVRFANTYVEKAIEWSRRIAEGEYEATRDQIESARSTIVDPSKSDEARAGELLSSFFQMVKDVEQREENLKLVLRQITIEIDDAKWCIPQIR